MALPEEAEKLYAERWARESAVYEKRISDLTARLEVAERLKNRMETDLGAMRAQLAKR